MSKKIPLLILAITLTVAYPLSSFSQIRNISRENRISYEKTISRLRKIELWDTKRGRLRSKPVGVSRLVTIQNLINQEEEVLSTLKSVYLQAERKNLEQAKDFKQTSLKFKERVICETSKGLLQAYDLSKRLEEVKSFEELSKLLESARLKFTILPLISYLSLKASEDIIQITCPVRSLESCWIRTDASNGASPEEELRKKEEEILFLLEVSLQISSVSSLDLELEEFIKRLAEMEFASLPAKPTPKTLPPTTYHLPPQYCAYTIRTNEGLILIYGTCVGVEREKANVEGISYYELKQEKLYKKIKESRLPGIEWIESFYRKPSWFTGKYELRIENTTLRAATLDNQLPIIEGLKEEFALSLLEAWGFEAQFRASLKGLDLKEVKKMFKERKRTVIISGTKKDSRVIIGEWIPES